MNKKKLQQTLKKLSMRPKKSLGQNFLIQQEPLIKIANAVRELSSKNPPQSIIEIGPGLGALSDFLSHIKAPLLLIEKDKKLASYLRNKNFNVKTQDALKIKNDFFKEETLLTGSLPYHIAGRLIVKASLEWGRVSGMVFLIQKEAGLRILSPQGRKSFGLLSVLVQNLWKMFQIGGSVSAQSFYPAPEVEGLILGFERKRKPDFDAKAFFQFTKFCFEQKRKMLKKRFSLKYGPFTEELWAKMNFPPSIRAEQIEARLFVTLFKALEKLKKRR